MIAASLTIPVYEYSNLIYTIKIINLNFFKILKNFVKQV
jgi:hypothetical protein